MIETKQSLVLPLRELCLRQVLKEVPAGSLNLQWMPIDLSQEVFDHCVGQSLAEEINQVFRLFLKSPSKTPLHRLSLQNCRRADVDLISELVKSNLKTLQHVDVRGCRTFPRKFWHLLNQAPNLLTLKTTKLSSPLKSTSLETLVLDWKPTRMFQKLQARVQSLFFDKLLEGVIPSLKHLDLSWCPWVRRLKCLKNARSLEVLILRNCDVSGLVEDICGLGGTLRVLDLSVGKEAEGNQDFNGEYLLPEQILEGLLNSLPKLESLDVSGTNLVRAVTSLLESEEKINGFYARYDNPLKFLGVYSTHYEVPPLEELPAKRLAASNDSKALLEAIKRNTDMPKTLHNQLIKLKLMQGLQDPKELLEPLLKMLKTLRLTEYFRFWGLKCMNSFLDSLDNPQEVIPPEFQRDLFQTLNKLITSHLEMEKIPEPVLCYTFKIFLKLLPIKQSRYEEDTRREVMRLGKFLMTQNSMAFVYLKTEALLFRLLHQISLEPEVCAYLGENKAVPNCFDFFKTLQIYLGFALSIRQTTEILPLVWKSIFNFLKASSTANLDFIKHCGLSWMYTHLSWFNQEGRVHPELYQVFTDILNHLERYSELQPLSECAQACMEKLRGLLSDATASLELQQEPQDLILAY